ncbi:DUF5129 domain-containing protein [Corynebacterium sp. A21]|uniref:DUF5129 domain-containing protein n=1 Tax=Corynebacterium sp. A21 TaxID=3457318 RepID=UPI003FCF3A6A
MEPATRNAPHWSRFSRAFALAAAAGLTTAPLLLGLGISGAAPAPAAESVLAQAPATTAVAVAIHNPDGELTEADIDFLTESTAGVELPASVTTVDYLILSENDENFNDTVLEYAKATTPELLNDTSLPDEDMKWAPGHLILAVGLDPHAMGVYCGDDVCNELGIYDQSRLDGILDQMREPLRQGNWAAGMLAGTQAAADPTVIREDNSLSGGAVAGIVGGVAVAGGAVAAAGVGYSQKKKGEKARERFDYVSANYGRVAQELQSIDIRAHSLSSPLANDALRTQWEDVKGRFLGLHEQMDQLSGLDSSSKDSDFRKKAKEIETAHETVTQMATAEENVERLAKMEHGDEDTRRRELTQLHEDTLEAEVTAKDSDGALAQRLRELDGRVLALRGELAATDFMDRYADLLADARVLNEAVQQEMYADLEQTTTHQAPTIYQSGWQPGIGYHNYVPFLLFSTWHQADYSAAQSAASSSSPSANTSFSSGFSGGGGSGSF